MSSNASDRASEQAVGYRCCERLARLCLPHNNGGQGCDEHLPVPSGIAVPSAFLAKGARRYLRVR